MRANTLLAAAVLFLLCWLYTADTRLDPGNGDPWMYLHAAQTVRAGEGLKNFTGTDFEAAVFGPGGAPLTVFPPLYPLLLALFGGTLESARLLNACLLWVALMLGWKLLAIYDVPRALQIGTLAAYLVFVSDWSRLYGSAMSETLFIPLFLAWLLVMPYADEDTGTIAYSILGGALALTRYIGLPFVLLGALWVWWKRGIMAALTYIALPGIALTAWLTRNYYLSGKFTGHALPGAYTWLSVYFLASVIAYWALLVMVLSGVAVCLRLCWRWWSSSMARSSSPVDS